MPVEREWSACASKKSELLAYEDQDKSGCTHCVFAGTHNNMLVLGARQGKL